MMSAPDVPKRSTPAPAPEDVPEPGAATSELVSLASHTVSPPGTPCNEMYDTKCEVLSLGEIWLP